jgi:hypothetical protein
MGFVGGSVMAANLKSKCSHFGRMKPVCSPLWRKGPVRARAWALTAIALGHHGHGGRGHFFPEAVSAK